MKKKTSKIIIFEFNRYSIILKYYIEINSILAYNFFVKFIAQQYYINKIHLLFYGFMVFT